MKLMLLAVVLLLQQIVSGRPRGISWHNEEYEFWTMDCKRRPLRHQWSFSDGGKRLVVDSKVFRFDEILSPTDTGNADIYKACDTRSCREVKKGYHCKEICNKTFKHADQDKDYGDLKSCPSDYGFIGYCKDKRGLDQYIRICMKDYLYPNHGAPLITRSGTCTNDDCTGLKFGDGDCDSDSDCAAGLRCGSNNCRSMHEQGKGKGCFDTSSDCCTGKDPWKKRDSLRETRLSHRWVIDRLQTFLQAMAGHP